MNISSVPETIGRMRVSRGISQAILAQRAGISVITLNKIESGAFKKWAPIDTLEAIFKALDYNVEIVLSRPVKE